MNVLFTCGGTAGHINPALALARLFRERVPECQILFVGADGGMETRLVPREGYALRTVTITNFQRGLSPAGVRHNVETLRNLSHSRRQAADILAEFRPDLVVGTGGYASFPVVREAARRGIPTAVHESNACPGLTTRALSHHVDRVMVGFEESRAYYPHPERVVVTGTPVRGDFLALTRREARAQLGMDNDRPLVLSYWGSLGASVMNQHMTDFILRECRAGAPFYHIHGAGRGYGRMQEALLAQGLDLSAYPEVRLLEYIYDMAAAMVAADLVLCRAGASTIAEVAALARPAVLVPSPNVTANHQEKNARVLAEQGAAVLLLESECGENALYDRACALLADGERLAGISRALRAMAVPDAGEKIFAALLELARG